MQYSYLFIFNQLIKLKFLQLYYTSDFCTHFQLYLIYNFLKGFNIMLYYAYLLSILYYIFLVILSS